MRLSRSCAVALTAGAVVLVPVSSAWAQDPSQSRQQAYQQAAAAYGVPESVLLGVSYLESRWDSNHGAPSTSAGYGPMHLTDAAYVSALPASGFEADPSGDPRGDTSRPLTVGPNASAATPASPVDAAAAATMDTAATLTGLDKPALRGDPAANIRGGAALLASYQQALGGPATANPADWYGAVAKYSGATDAGGAQDFADQVYQVIQQGLTRTTDDGQAVSLPATQVAPNRGWLDRLHLPRLTRPDGLQCPDDVSCEWLPSPYQLLGDGTDPYNYGNHDTANRPADSRIEYIVIHDTEESFASAVRGATNPNYLGWHYTIRSADGHIAQHMKVNDVGWHAGNWYVNGKSIGIEHEGFAASQGQWYTEALYRNSAKLVRYLALRLGIPLDRAHVIGHDNVPGTVPSTVAGMHWDPGPYWDWSHYFDLLKAPFRGIGTAHGGLVTIDPTYATNQPAFTGCTGTATNPCPLHGSSSVILHTTPDASSPLLTDLGLHQDGSPSTMYISDHGARASTGQQYAVADVRGDWTAIWYLGQKGWFYNPSSAPAALWSVGLVVTPKAGRASIPVYGRAYPEAGAYPAGVTPQSIVPLQYQILAGQRYSVGNVLRSEYYRAVTFDNSAPSDHTFIKGQLKYVQIQLGHRIAYVNLDDVDVRPSLR
jgi:hypothetical protein